MNSSATITTVVPTSRFTPFGLLLLARQQSVTVTVTQDASSLRVSSPDPSRITQVRPFVAEIKPTLLLLLSPGTPTAWLWDLYRSPTLHLAGSIRDSSSTWWPIQRTTESIILQLADRGTENHGASLLFDFHHVHEYDCQEWRSHDFEDQGAWRTGYADSVDRPGHRTPWLLSPGEQGSIQVRKQVPPPTTYPPGNIYARGPSGEIGYVSPHRIPPEATEYRQHLTGGLGEWIPIPLHWRTRE